MFTIFTNLKNGFNNGLDESKLIEFRKNATKVNETKFLEYCKEIHYIMQRHFTNDKMLLKCQETLQYMEDIKKLRDEIKDFHIFSINNTIVTKNFTTSWGYETIDKIKKN